MIRGHRNKTVTIKGVRPPQNAGYPDVSFQLTGEWCPNCGYIRQLQSKELGLRWINRELFTKSD